MGGYRRAFHIGGEGRLDALLEARDREWQATIQQEREDYLLKANEADYFGHLVSRFTIDVPQLVVDEIHVDSEERQIPAARFPNTFHVREGQSYPKHVVIYRIPVVGDASLLRYQARTFLTWRPEIHLDGSCVCFEILSFSQNSEEIKAEASSILNALHQLAGFLAADLNAYNQELPSRIERAVRGRKANLLAKSEMLAQLGVPIRKRTDVPGSFAIPVGRVHRIVLPKPEVQPGRFVPEPSIDQTTYVEILKVLDAAGKNLERLPSTYAGRQEEDLRDFMLFALGPHFMLDGSVTGETFNRSGKTDILVRYQNANVFAAECKYWDGKQAYLGTIDQLLGYLTFRDAKAAVVIFDQNRGFTADLAKIAETTPQHPNYRRSAENLSETWFNYEFHLPDDQERVVQLAVLAFHLPPERKTA